MSENKSKLTERQKSLIEEKRKVALERLAQTKKRQFDEGKTSSDNNNNTNDNKNNNKKARWTTFYEYDLSKLENTKGGYIVDEVIEEKINKFKEQATKIDPYLRKHLIYTIIIFYLFERKKEIMYIFNCFLLLAYSLDPNENPKCRDCKSMDVDNIFFQVFNISVCNACKEKYPERYSLITKTEAKEVKKINKKKYKKKV